MQVENLLKKNNIKYTLKKNKNVYIFEFENETVLVCIVNNKNVFSINRDTFYKIDDMLLPYAFCLIDSTYNQMYFMRVKEPNNFLRKSFENSSKDVMFFGKEILQNKIDESKLLKEIEIIGEY